jgi:hypothetical protein
VTYSVFDDNASVPDLHASWEGHEVKVQGVTYEVRSLEDTYLLECGGKTVARATIPSGYSGAIVVEHDEKSQELQPERGFIVPIQRRFDLREGDQVIGTVRSSGVNDMEADLPERIPLAVKIFMLWLVMARWMQEAAASV